jgi:serine/threonine protein kinase
MTPAPENSTISADVPNGEQVGQGRYVVVGSLGAGSQGETLAAVDKREGRPVAIKRFTIRGAKSWKDVELAEREATVLASLDHPSLPRYIDHFEENGALYLVMEKVEGESLAARRRRQAPLQHEQVLRFLTDAAACLRYLHGHAPPIVHRDIKPGNVLLRPDGSYCFVDFGSVRDRLKPEGGSTVVGTFGFMAPEQFQGRAAPVSDVYAVGATALSLITGREPEDLPHKGLGIDVEAALRGLADRRLVAALRSMLEPDPDRRATSVDAALQLAGLGAHTTFPGTSPAQAAKNARRARLEAEATFESRVRQEADAAFESAWSHHTRRHEEKARQRRERDAHRREQRAERQARKAERREARHFRRHERGQWHRPASSSVS